MKDIELELNVPEVNLVLEALGALPFVRVFGLIGKIQEQARRQVESSASEPADPGSPIRPVERAG